MKKLIYALVIFPMIIYSQIDYQINIDKTDINFSRKDNYDIIEISKFDLSGTTAAPYLPIKTFGFIIPNDQKVIGIKINYIEEDELDGKFKIYPTQPESIIDYEWLNLKENKFTEPDKNIYEKDEVYPARVVENTGFQYFSGAKISSIVFNPLRYNPVTGVVKYVKSIKITLILGNDVDNCIKPLRLSERSAQSIKKRILNLVENSQDIDQYYQVDEINVELNKTESFNPTEIPSLVGNNIDYVIITNEELKERFQQISDWKTKKGLPAVVRTVEWINNHYAGCDGAEKIRNFIIDANIKWGTIWFLLGGDENIVPLRYVWHSPWDHWQLLDLKPNGEFIPSDMYFACLDGNWNADGDATFGEGSYNRNNDGTFSLWEITQELIMLI